MKWVFIQLEIINFRHCMNYLAHLALAYPNPGLLAGNYIYDLISKKEEQTIHPLFQNGIQLHKWIDDFSNNNIYLKEINKSLHPVVHKYAPVASDIICDYLLYQNWHQYYTIPFYEFENNSYLILQDSCKIMPARVALICQKMVAHRWLTQYKSLEGIWEVLHRTNKKTKFPVNLQLALPILETNLNKFQDLFHSFFLECKKQSLEVINLQNETKW